MNKVIERKGFGWSYLVIGILFIIVALVAFRNPMDNLLALAFLFGLTAIASGVWLIVFRFGSRTRLVVGIVEIVIGALLIANLEFTAGIVTFLFAAWFILDSIGNLYWLRSYRALGPGYYWFTLIINVLGIVLGVVMLFEPLLSALTLAFIVGVFFMLLGIEYILIAFSNPTTRIEIDEA